MRGGVVIYLRWGRQCQRDSAQMRWSGSNLQVEHGNDDTYFRFKQPETGDSKLLSNELLSIKKFQETELVAEQQL